MKINPVDIHVLMTCAPCFYVKLWDGTRYDFSEPPNDGESYDEWFERCGSERAV